MSAAALVVAAIVLAALSGLPGLFCGRRSAAGERIASAAMALAAALGIAGSALALGRSGARSSALAAPWPVPGGEFRVEVDGLSAVFLLPIFLVALLGSVYGLRYWRQADHPADGRRLRLFYGLLAAGMALLVVARNAVLFLAGWELMAASAFLVITVEDGKEEVRASGHLYLAATRLGTLALLGLFAVLAAATGSFAFGLGGQVVPGPYRNAVFLLALVGFGLKAGIWPLHVWLPGAHAAAPSHVSAFLSGVMIKTGIYGLVRIASMVPEPPFAWAAVLLGLGLVSAVAGVVLAIGQHDLKRLLAYHSVENIGIITLGLGVALAGRSLGRHDLVALGLAGALLHVWNHALFKSLLFLGAGSVILAARTRDIDALGGLGRSMPRAALAFLLGAVAICGLPPLNGFASELLVYLGLLRAVAAADAGTWLLAALAVPALALVGGLALACFAKVYGAVFLGEPRSASARHPAAAHDASLALAAPMAVLAVLCAAIGLVPWAVVPLLERAIGPWLAAGDAGRGALGRLAPLAVVGELALALLGLVALLALLLGRRLGAAPRAAGPTWDCGFAAPTARMQYSSSSFAWAIVGLFSWLLRPRSSPPRIAGPFPAGAAFSSRVTDVVLDGAVLPAARLAGRASAWFRWFQRGSVHAYIAYVLLTLVLLHLLWR